MSALHVILDSICGFIVLFGSLILLLIAHTELPLWRARRRQQPLPIRIDDPIPPCPRGERHYLIRTYSIGLLYQRQYLRCGLCDLQITIGERECLLMRVRSRWIKHSDVIISSLITVAQSAFTLATYFAHWDFGLRYILAMSVLFGIETWTRSRHTKRRTGGSCDSRCTGR
jgi:hypothetical protein